MEFLKDHRRWQAEFKLYRGAHFVDQDLLFTTSKGKPMSHHEVRLRIFKGLLREAELRDICFHDLRSTCAMLMIANNENLRKSVHIPSPTTPFG